MNQVIDRYGIHFRPFYAPIYIDAKKNTVTFKWVGPNINPDGIQENNALKERIVDGTHIEMPFDMLHIAPPQAAPKFIRESSLVNEAGWLAVHPNTLQHEKYANIFGLGDVAGLPTAKTGAAIRKQVPVVVDNIRELIANQTLGQKSYNGYSSCPLVTGYGKMVLAEFDYDQNFTPDPRI